MQNGNFPPIHILTPEEEREDYLLDLALEYRPQKFRFAELVDIYGSDEVRQILRDKIPEEYGRYRLLLDHYRIKVAYIKWRNFSEFKEWFWLRWLEETCGKRLAESAKLLKKFAYQYETISGPKPSSNTISLQKIETAREYPIADLYDGKLRRSGSNLVGLCPFHQEKTPSFYVYRDNSFHCFGCSKHGNNAIDFLMARDGLEFPEAVRRLS